MQESQYAIKKNAEEYMEYVKSLNYWQKEVKEKENNGEKEKEKGNQYFKIGEYEKAIVEYSAAIKKDSTSNVFYLNRAMAYLKLKE
jgi:tetratricopeptide (TPR) repeat protein